MRGKAAELSKELSETGITPAHAGKSARPLAWLTLCGDHPRTCGEKPVVTHVVFIRSGSPPHMRGKVRLRYTAAFLAGITPAHAGKSSFERLQDRLRGDHPRTCGEKTCRP